jgi:Domain of unknown function (DUF4375)
MKTNAEEGYWSLIEPMWDQLNEAWDISPEEFVDRFAAIGSDAKHLYATHWCISEVDNGGFLQFFWNTTGILAPEAMEGFKVVGMTNLAQVLDEAIKHFGDSYPRERNERLASLPDWQRGGRSDWDPFHNLDKRFYEYSIEWKDAANAFMHRIQRGSNG